MNKRICIVYPDPFLHWSMVESSLCLVYEHEEVLYLGIFIISSVSMTWKTWAKNSYVKEKIMPLLGSLFYRFFKQKLHLICDRKSSLPKKSGYAVKTRWEKSVNQVDTLLGCCTSEGKCGMYIGKLWYPWSQALYDTLNSQANSRRQYLKQPKNSRFGYISWRETSAFAFLRELDMNP